MTTSQRLWLGFGALTILLVAICGAILVRVRAIDSQLRRMTSARERGMASRELEINALGYALSVRDYLRSGEASYLRHARSHAFEVERALGQYRRLAATGRQLQMARSFQADWRQLQTLGEKLIASPQRPPGDSDLRRFMALRVRLVSSLDARQQLEAEREYYERQRTALETTRNIFAFALLLLVVGLVLAIVTSWTLGSAVVHHERLISEQGERLRITLASIGDAVLTTDEQGRVTHLNPVAESLTGWTTAEAAGRPLEEVFRIVHEETREPVENPAAKALREGAIVGLANHTVLIARDGAERVIDDSAAPIRRRGEMVGCVLVFRDITEKRRLEKLAAARSAADRQLAVIVESSDDAIVGKTLDGVIRSWNAAAERLFGHTAEQAIGQPITILIPPDRLDEERRIIERLRAGKRVEHFDTVRVRRDGRLIDVSLTISPVRDEEGRVVGASKIARDISQRKQAERQRTDSEARIRSVVDHVVDGIITIDENGLVESFNPAAERIFGYSADEVLGRNVNMLMPEPFHSQHDDYLASYLKTGQAKIIGIGREVIGRCKSGATFPMDLAVSEFTFGGRRYFTGIVRDITDRRRAEQQLRSLSDELRQILDTAAAGLTRCGSDLNYLMANPAYAEIVGRPVDQIVGRPIVDVVGREAFQLLRPHIDRVLRGERVEFEAELPLAARGPRVLHGVYAPERNDRGEVTGWVASVIDITQRKRMENELRSIAAELSDAHHRKDEFLATLAHELRNPLAPIRNAVQIIRQSPDEQVVHQAKATMERQLAQMSRLVDDLLDLSRITRGQIELRKAPTTLAAVVSSAVETSRPLIEEMGHQLTVTIPEEPVHLLADLTRLSQVFANLLNNAAKYTDPRGQIWLTAEQQNGEVVARVKDTGIGISPEHAPRIFEMFSQLDRSLEKAQGGLGIGLTLVRRLVEMHGGRVAVHSEGLGRGTEFTVWLPIVIAPPQAEPEQPPPAEAKSRLRIAVVDDNKDGADTLAMMLTILGHHTHTAYDGEAAVALAERIRPDVMLMDIGLPKLNGYEACRRIRQNPGGERIVLIAVTGWGQDDDRRRSRDAGFDHHLVKPVNPAELIELLSRLEVPRSCDVA